LQPPAFFLCSLHHRQIPNIDTMRSAGLFRRELERLGSNLTVDYHDEIASTKRCV
jgi:hypothetical protein